MDRGARWVRRLIGKDSQGPHSGALASSIAKPKVRFKSRRFDAHLSVGTMKPENPARGIIEDKCSSYEKLTPVMPQCSQQ
jgi:hypothetical protein